MGMTKDTFVQIDIHSQCKAPASQSKATTEAKGHSGFGLFCIVSSREFVAF